MFAIKAVEIFWLKLYQVSMLMSENFVQHRERAFSAASLFVAKRFYRVQLSRLIRRIRTKE